MESLSKKSAKKPPAILILADFSDGSWHAISFGMQFLYTPQSPIFILPTFQNPNFGQSMLRDIVPRLKKITKQELRVLKSRLLRNFKIKAKYVKLLSLNGELVSILQDKQDLKELYNLVIGTYSSFVNSCTMQNLCMTKIINCSSNPLFILPQMFEHKENKKILFVANPFKVPSMQIKNHILSICEKINSELDILFVVENESQKKNKEVQEFFEKYFKEIKYAINYVINSSVCKGM